MTELEAYLEGIRREVDRSRKARLSHLINVIRDEERRLRKARIRKLIVIFCLSAAMIGSGIVGLVLIAAR